LAVSNNAQVITEYIVLFIIVMVMIV